MGRAKHGRETAGRGGRTGVHRATSRRPDAGPRRWSRLFHEPRHDMVRAAEQMRLGETEHAGRIAVQRLCHRQPRQGSRRDAGIVAKGPRSCSSAAPECGRGAAAPRSLSRPTCRYRFAGTDAPAVPTGRPRRRGRAKIEPAAGGLLISGDRSVKFPGQDAPVERQDRRAGKAQHCGQVYLRIGEQHIGSATSSTSRSVCQEVSPPLPITARQYDPRASSTARGRREDELNRPEMPRLLKL